MVRRLLILALLTLLAGAGVKVFYVRLERRLQGEMAAAGSGGRTVVAESPAVRETGKSVKQRDYQVIVRRNIFQARLDEGKRQEKEEEQKSEDLAETSLKLALVGTVTGSERDARAIIVDEKKKRQDIYQIGDAVQGALIRKIERGRVVLEVNGRDEVLLIKERKGGVPGKGVDTPMSNMPSAVPPASVRSGNRRTVPLVRPHRRITFRNDRAREVAEPATPLSTEEPPPRTDSVPGRPQRTGDDEAVQ